MFKDTFRFRDFSPLDKFTHADGESLWEVWWRFNAILQRLPHRPSSEPELYCKFTKGLRRPAIEFLSRVNAQKFSDLSSAARLNDLLDEARSTGSQTFAVRGPSDLAFVNFVLANVSNASSIDGVYVSFEGNLLRFSTSVFSKVETYKPPDEKEPVTSLSHITDTVQHTGLRSITSNDAPEREFHDYILHLISDAGTAAEEAFARAKEEGIRLHITPKDECSKGNTDIVYDVVPEPLPIFDSSPRANESTDLDVDETEALLDQEEIRLIIEEHETHSNEFRQSFLSRHC